MVWKIIRAAAVCAVLYLLWTNGYLATQAKLAIKYFESDRGRCASFSACTGFTRRRVRFSESRVYHFTLEAELSKGEVSAELLDAAEQSILCLTADAPTAEAELDSKHRYALVFHFQSATGDYTLSWD